MPKRVLAIFAGTTQTPGACELYRVTMPFYTVGQQSSQWVMRWTWFSEIARDFGNRGVNAIFDLIAQNDVFVFPRMFFQEDKSKEMVAFLYSAIRANNKRIVYEVDDDYTNIHRTVVDGDAMTPARWADAVTVSTPYLGELMRQHTGRPVYVLPNCIAPDLWCAGTAPERTEMTQNKVIIALTGSLTHHRDWQVLETVMPRILDENPNVYFIMMGFHPSYLEGLPQTAYLPGMRYENYASIIRGSDIVLAPIDPTDGFNAYKSPIKAIEGMGAQRLLEGQAMGAAVIATDNPVYRLAIKNDKTGLLVAHTPEAWYNAISTLVRRPEYRTDLQRGAYRWVYRHHDITQEWKQWAFAYSGILSSPLILCIHTQAT